MRRIFAKIAAVICVCMVVGGCSVRDEMCIRDSVEMAQGRDGDEPLFVDQQGKMLRRTHGPNSPSSWFYWAKKRALGDVLARKMTVHDLRHTAASLLVSAGANVKVVQRQLGHESAAMTLDTYADLFLSLIHIFRAHVLISILCVFDGGVDGLE